MKNTWMTWTVATALLLSLAGAVRAEDKPPASDRESDHAALRELLVEATKEFNNQNLEALFSHFTKDFVFIAVDQTVLTDVAAAKGFYDRMLRQADSKVTKITVEPSADILTRFTGEKSGYCYGKTRDTYTVRSTGRTVVVDGRWTAVVVKEGERWKVAALHSGVNFIDNPVLAYQSRSFLRKLLLGMGFGKYPGEP